MCAESGEQTVPNGVPVVEHPVRPAKEARPEYGIGAALDQRLEERRPVRGTVFEIGVLHDHYIAGAGGDRRTYGSALASVPLLMDDAMDSAVREKPGQNVTCPIRGTVVDAYYFGRVGRGPHQLYYLCDRVFLVVNRNENGYEHLRFLQWSYGSEHVTYLSRS